MTSEIKVHLLGRSGNLYKIGVRVHHQTYSRKNRQKKKEGQNEKTCALACLKETAAAETSSFILRFWVFVRTPLSSKIFRFFQLYSGFTARWEHFAVCSSYYAHQTSIYFLSCISALGSQKSFFFFISHYDLTYTSNSRSASALHRNKKRKWTHSGLNLRRT